MLHLHFVFILLFTSKIGQEQEITQHYRKSLACEEILAEIENRETACEIERALSDEGFDEPLVKAALVNSYAESKFNPWAIGDNGNSIGVFQLNKNGLGHEMTNAERHDVKTSVRRVSIAIRKSRRLQGAIESGAETAELIELFCTEIMRPSNKYTKARQRRSTETLLFGKSTPKRRRLRSTKSQI